MRSMQEKVLTRLENAVAETEAEAVQSKDYANTGTVFIMVGMEAIWSVTYAFHPGYCSLNGKVAHYHEPGALFAVVEEAVQQVQGVIAERANQ